MQAIQLCDVSLLFVFDTHQVVALEAYQAACKQAA